MCSSLLRPSARPVSSFGERFVVLRRTRFAEYSPCHHVCRIFHRRRRNESSDSHLGGRPSTPRWRLSSLALRPAHLTQASSGGCGETSAASTSILRGRPHALAMPMNPFRVFECSQEMSRGEKLLPRRRRSVPPDDGSKACHPQSALVAHRGSYWPVVSVGVHVTKPSRASLGAPLSWPKLRGRLRHIIRASTDGALPSTRGSRWASTLELALLVPGHRRHGGEIETVTMALRLAAGLPSLPPDASRRVRFDQPRGHS